MRTRHRGNVRTWLYQKYFSRSCRKLKNYSLSSRRKLIYWAKSTTAWPKSTSLSQS